MRRTLRRANSSTHVFDSIHERRREMGVNYQPYRPKSPAKEWINFLNHVGPFGQTNREVLNRLDCNDELEHYLIDSLGEKQAWRIISHQYRIKGAGWDSEFAHAFQCPWQMRDAYQVFMRSTQCSSDPMEVYDEILNRFGEMKAEFQETDGSTRMIGLDFSYLLPDNGELSYDYGGAEAWENFKATERESAYRNWLFSKASPRTRREYESRIRMLMRATDHSDLSQFLDTLAKNPEGLAEQARLSWQSEGRGEEYYRHPMSTLSDLGRWLHTHGLAGSAPQFKVGGEPKRHIDLDGMPSYEDVRRVEHWIAEQPEPYRLLVSALIGCLFYNGLRASETLSLRLCDLRAQGETWIAMIKMKGHFDRRQPVVISAETLKRLRALEHWIKRCYPDAEPSTAFFLPPSALGFGHKGPAPKAMTRQTLETLFARMSEAVEMKICPHDLRHAAITWLIQRGEAVESVANFARHSTTYTTERYVNTPGSTARKLMDCLAEGVAA